MDEKISYNIAQTLERWQLSSSFIFTEWLLLKESFFNRQKARSFFQIYRCDVIFRDGAILLETMYWSTVDLLQY